MIVIREFVTTTVGGLSAIVSMIPTSVRTSALRRAVIRCHSLNGKYQLGWYLAGSNQ